MTPNQKLHCCLTNNCTGETYFGWNLSCRFCNNKIMIECLRDQDETRMKNILHLFGLIEKVTSSDRVSWEIVNSQSSFAVLSKIFAPDSPFGITCQICAAKIVNTKTTASDHQLNTDLHINSNENNNSNLVNTNINNNANAFNTSTNLLDMSFLDFQECITDSIRNVVRDLPEFQLPSTSKVTMRKNRNTTKNSTQPEESKSSATEFVRQNTTKILPKDGTFSIHVSKFPRDATIDDVVSIILEKTDLHIKSFKVEKISNHKIRGKSREFSSFKVSTWFQEVCDKIIDSNIWNPNYIATPFKHIDPNTRPNNTKPIGKLNPLKNKKKSDAPNPSQPKENSNHRHEMENNLAQNQNHNTRRHFVHTQYKTNENSAPTQNHQIKHQYGNQQRRSRNTSSYHHQQLISPYHSPPHYIQPIQQPHWLNYNQNQATNYPFWYHPVHHYPPIQPFNQRAPFSQLIYPMNQHQF